MRLIPIRPEDCLYPEVLQILEDLSAEDIDSVLAPTDRLPQKRLARVVGPSGGPDCQIESTRMRYELRGFRLGR